MADFDLAIIGGGINGTGLARDAAGRGVRVLLVEMNDLASGTSSASSKLIHGGLRYLEHGAFRLVREALHEREVLLRMAPHVIRPLRFMLPPMPGLRSPLLLRLGLFVYDMLGGRKLLPRHPHRRSHPSCGRPAAAAAVPLRLRIFRLPGRRFPAGGAQRARCRRARRRHPHPHAADARRAARRMGTGAQQPRPPRGRNRARAGQRRRSLDRRGGRHRDPAAAAGAGAPDQGQPHRGAAAFRARRRLSFAGRRPARGVRAAFRAGFHADRHHGRGFRRRSQFAGARSGRDPLSVRHGEPIFPRQGAARRIGLVVHRRARAL